MAYRYVRYHYETPDGHSTKGVEVYLPSMTDKEISEELRDDMQVWATAYCPPGYNFDEFVSYLAKCKGVWKEIPEDEFHKLEEMWG